MSIALRFKRCAHKDQSEQYLAAYAQYGSEKTRRRQCKFEHDHDGTVSFKDHNSTSENSGDTRSEKLSYLPNRQRAMTSEFNGAECSPIRKVHISTIIKMDVIFISDMNRLHTSHMISMVNLSTHPSDDSLCSYCTSEHVHFSQRNNSKSISGIADLIVSYQGLDHAICQYGAMLSGGFIKSRRSTISGLV